MISEYIDHYTETTATMQHYMSYALPAFVVWVVESMPFIVAFVVVAYPTLCVVQGGLRVMRSAKSR